MATTDTNLARSGQIQIEKAVIVSGANKPFDITNLFNEITFTESVNSHIIYGSITMQESLNLLEAIPILSEESVELTFKVPYGGEAASDDKPEETRTLYFEVIGVSDINVVSERTQTYTLNIASREYNQFVKLGPITSFKQTPSDVVESLLKLVNIETATAPDKDVYIEETVNKQHFVFPALSISEGIEMCVKRATNGSPTGHTYKFFENLRGFNFKSLGTMINDKPVMSIFYSQVNSQDEKAKTALYTDSAARYTVLSRNDSSEFLYDGGYRANIISFDPILKKIVKKDFDISKPEDKKRVNMIDEFPSQSETFLNYNTSDVAETFSYTADLGRGQNIYAKDKDTFFPEHYNDFILERNASKAMIKNTIVRIIIPGTTRVAAGDMINFFPPDQSAVNDPDYDKYLKGKYIVSEVEHLMSTEQYAMTLTCLKSGVPEKVGS